MSKEQELVEALLTSLRSDEWTRAEYALQHKASGITLWVGNGWSSCDIWATPCRFSRANRRRLYAAAQDCVRSSVLAALKGGAK